MLQPMLARADDEQMPVYLETHNLQNVALYERRRFSVVGEGCVPGSRVPVFAMLRRPILKPWGQDERVESSAT